VLGLQYEVRFQNRATPRRVARMVLSYLDTSASRTHVVCYGRRPKDAETVRGTKQVYRRIDYLPIAVVDYLQWGWAPWARPNRERRAGSIRVPGSRDIAWCFDYSLPAQVPMRVNWYSLVMKFKSRIRVRVLESINAISGVLALA